MQIQAYARPAPRRPGRTRPRLATVVVIIATGFVALSCSDSEPAADPVEQTTTSPPTDTVEVEVEDTVAESSGVDVQEQDPAEDAGAEFIDLPFWSGFVPELGGSIQPADECDNSDPDLLVCEFDQIGTLFATHLGVARDAESGTKTSYLAESCIGADGKLGNPEVWEASGTMTTVWGDEAYFRLRNPLCSAGAPLVANWVIDGGTGRFEDAYGLMSVMPWPGEEFFTVSTGTLRVRADLWEEILPPL